MSYDFPSRALVRTVQPSVEPLTLAEAKLYLRVDGSTDDALITDLVVAARIAAEEYLKRSLITQSWKLSLDESIGEITCLPRGPVISISSVTLFQRDETSTALSSSIYYLNAAKNALVMDAPAFSHRIEVVYQAGYGDASSIPRAIKQGMLAHLATLYDKREDGAAIPSCAIELYAPFREVKL